MAVGHAKMDISILGRVFGFGLLVRNGGRGYKEYCTGLYRDPVRQPERPEQWPTCPSSWG